MDDQQLKYFLTANMGNPTVVAQVAAQQGFGADDIARVTGYAPEQIAAHFNTAGVALPTAPAAGSNLNPTPTGAPAPMAPAGGPNLVPTNAPALPSQASPTAALATSAPGAVAATNAPLTASPTTSTSPTASTGGASFTGTAPKTPASATAGPLTGTAPKTALPGTGPTAGAIDSTEKPKDAFTEGFNKVSTSR